MFNLFNPSGRDTSIKEFADMAEKFFGSGGTYGYRTVTYKTTSPEPTLQYRSYKNPEIDKQCARVILDTHTFRYSKGATVYFVFDGEVVKATVVSRKVNIIVYDDPNVTPSYVFANNYDLEAACKEGSKEFYGICQSKLFGSLEEMVAGGK